MRGPSADEIDRFVEDGYLVVRGAVAHDVVCACVRDIEAELRAAGTDPDDPARDLDRTGRPHRLAVRARVRGRRHRAVLWATDDALIGPGRWRKHQGVDGTVPVRFPPDRDPVHLTVAAHEGGWLEPAEIIDGAPACSAAGAGPAVDLVDRPQQARSQFVFTEVRGRAAVFWQTQKVARTANPGDRVPHRRAPAAAVTIHVDTREKYRYRFAARDVTVERGAMTTGDYGVRIADGWLAVVERKSFDNLATSLADCTLALQLCRLAEMPLAAMVVEGRYPALFAVPRVAYGWLPDILVRLPIRYHEGPTVFADSRKFAEEWTYRFLAAALSTRPIGLRTHQRR